MERTLSKAARDALAATDWRRIDAMTDQDLARQIATNPDAAPDMAPEIDVRAIRRAAGMTQAQFAEIYAFSIRTVQEWERGAKNRVARRVRCCARSRPTRRGCEKRLLPGRQTGRRGVGCLEPTPRLLVFSELTQFKFDD